MFFYRNIFIVTVRTGSHRNRQLNMRNTTLFMNTHTSASNSDHMEYLINGSILECIVKHCTCVVAIISRISCFCWYPRYNIVPVLEYNRGSTYWRWIAMINVPIKYLSHTVLSMSNWHQSKICISYSSNYHWYNNDGSCWFIYRFNWKQRIGFIWEWYCNTSEQLKASWIT